VCRGSACCTSNIWQRLPAGRRLGGASCLGRGVAGRARETQRLRVRSGVPRGWVRATSSVCVCVCVGWQRQSDRGREASCEWRQSTVRFFVARSVPRCFLPVREGQHNRGGRWLLRVAACPPACVCARVYDRVLPRHQLSVSASVVASGGVAVGAVEPMLLRLRLRPRFPLVGRQQQDARCACGASWRPPQPPLGDGVRAHWSPASQRSARVCCAARVARPARACAVVAWASCWCVDVQAATKRHTCVIAWAAAATVRLLRSQPGVRGSMRARSM
jgi:hypothetical protein